MVHAHNSSLCIILHARNPPSHSEPYISASRWVCHASAITLPITHTAVASRPWYDPGTAGMRRYGGGRCTGVRLWPLL